MAFELGSLTDSAASPAVEITFAAIVLVYTPATPGMNEPRLAEGVPSVSESVAGTVAPTGRSACTAVTPLSSSAVAAVAAGADGGLRLESQPGTPTAATLTPLAAHVAEPGDAPAGLVAPAAAAAAHQQLALAGRACRRETFAGVLEP